MAESKFYFSETISNRNIFRIDNFWLQFFLRFLKGTTIVKNFKTLVLKKNSKILVVAHASSARACFDVLFFMILLCVLFAI